MCLLETALTEEAVVMTGSSAAGRAPGAPRRAQPCQDRGQVHQCRVHRYSRDAHHTSGARALLTRPVTCCGSLAGHLFQPMPYTLECPYGMPKSFERFRNNPDVREWRSCRADVSMVP